MVPVALASRHVGPLGEAWHALRSGRVRHANTLLLQVSRLTAHGQMTLSPAESVLVGAMSVDGRLAVGDVAGAAATAESLAPHAEGEEASAAALLAMGEVAAALGDHARALAHFYAAAELPEVDVVRPWRSGAALALVRTGKRRDAAALAREQVERSYDDAWGQAVGLRTLAIADTGHDPIGTLREAGQIAGLTPDRRLCTQIDADVAALTLLDPFSTETASMVALLRAGEQYAGAEGLWPLHARIARLLERAGERPRPLEGEALALLTVAERRVARLAADGLTNREIADSLALTVKGVEWHLSRVYRKLGIGSRTGLAGLLTTELAS